MIKGHLENFNIPSVATSWGKDSTILSALVVRACKELDIKPTDKKYPVFYLNHTNNVYSEEPQYWKDIVKFLEIPNEKFKIFKPRNGKTVWSIAKDVGFIPMFRRGTKTKYIPYKFRKEPDCCDQLKKEPTSDYLLSIPKEERYDLSFVGTRADESQMRRLNILMHCRTYSTDYGRPYKIRVAQPIAFWKMEDTEKYFKDYNIPVNPAYEIHKQERLGCASCPAHIGWEIRLGRDETRTGKFMLYQNLKILQVTQPNRFRKTLEILKKEKLASDVISKILIETPLEGWKLAEWDIEDPDLQTEDPIGGH